MSCIRRTGLLGAMVAAAILVPIAPAYASVGVSGSLTVPASVTAGQTGLAGSFTVINTNTAPNQAESNTVSSLRIAPSCGSSGTAAAPCPTPDSGVLGLGSTATGAAGTACAGTSFTVSPPNATGIVTLTPTSTVVLAPPGGPPGSDRCTVNFSFSVLKVPTVDSNPGTPGRQTRFNLDAQVTSSTTSQTVATRPSTEITVAQGNPTLTTSAVNAAVGQPIHDTATLAGGATPSGTVTFRLYSDPLCTTEIFTSTNPVNAAGDAISPDFTPALIGSYRWRASYSGDANNVPVPLAACNEPGETSAVTEASEVPQPPVNPPQPPGVPAPQPATTPGTPTAPGTPPPTKAPDEGLTDCAATVTVGTNGTVKLCDATNPPTASTSQTLKGSLPAKLDATATKRKPSKPAVLGQGQTTVPAGQSTPVVARLGAKAKKALAKRVRLVVVAVIEARGTDGKTATLTRTVSLHAKKKRKRP